MQPNRQRSRHLTDFTSLGNSTMIRLRASIAAICLAMALPVALSTAADRMTPELLWKLGRLGDTAISPDGRSIAFVVRYYDLAKNKGRSQLFLIKDSSQPQKLLEADSIGSLQWVELAGRARLFYTAPAGKEKRSQVWMLTLGSGTPRQLTHLEQSVSNLKVAPTGDRIAFTMRVKMDPTVSEIYPDLPKADARIIDGLMYRHWDRWHDYRYSHVHVAELTADGKVGKPVDLMKGLRANCPVPPFGGASEFAWSPDGRQVALTLKLVNNWAESTDTDIYLVDLENPSRRKCITPGMNGYDNNPVYSPDGRYLAFHSMARAGFESDRNRIMLYDRSSGKIRELTRGLDQNANHAHWLPDSRGLIFVSEWRGTNQLFRILVRDGRTEQITTGRYNWDLVGFLPEGRLLVQRQSMLRPWELYELDPDSRTATEQVTHINDAIYASLELPQIRERWIRSSDGALVHNWVIYPPDFDANRKWPMLTYFQGGPQGQIGQWFSYRWNFHLMAANGYVVLAVNRRGLPGFGRKWNDEISGDWGGQAMQDILAATDDMMSESYIDRRRVAGIGASFGGYTGYWMMGHHEDRFCTIIAHAGVFNLESMYGSTEELFFVNWDLGGPYWKNPQVQRNYNRFSPHRFVGNWKTPL
ncbi:MAG TPA: S9 family peptidase, partial [Planctomycetaceae bacterium]|nr:S9 family peptidase [Planctomycetaceae bacterium]